MAGEYIEFNNLTQPAVNDTNLNLLQQLIKQDIQGAVSGDTLPIGVIMPFGSDTVPENWLLCNGQEVSRTTYSDLFNTIGTAYGAGDGFTTFNLPDLTGKVTVGKDSDDTDFNALGNTGGEKEHTLTIEEMPSHNHGIKINAPTSAQQYSSGTARWPYQTDDTAHKWTEDTGGGEAHNILQPYLITNYIIKAYQSSGVVATVVDNLISTSTTDALSSNQGRVLNEKFSKNELWINSSPTASFSGQTITLSSNDYDYLLIFYARTPSLRNEMYSCIVEANGTTELLHFDYFNNVARAWSRAVEVSGTSVTFGDSTINGSTNNASLVPYKIMGGKY